MKKLIVLAVLCLSLQGCFFIFLPVGLIVRAFQGPRLCATRTARVGDILRTPKGELAKITEIHGSDAACQVESSPIYVTVEIEGR